MIETSELTNRILQLRDSQGLSFIEITNLLTNEGVVGRDKQPLNVNSVKARYSRFKRAKKRSQDGDGAPSESSHTEHHTKHHTTSRNGKARSENSHTEKVRNQQEAETITRLDLRQLKIHLEEYVRKLVQDALGSSQQSSSHTQSDTSHTMNVQTLVREEVSKIIGDIRAEQVQKSGRAGIVKTVKKTVSIPVEIYTPVDELGGIFSNHVAAALRLYLKILKEGKR